jgi:ABC-type multidrug transport system ATPase subunit
MSKKPLKNLSMDEVKSDLKKEGIILMETFKRIVEIIDNCQPSPEVAYYSSLYSSEVEKCTRMLELLRSGELLRFNTKERLLELLRAMKVDQNNARQTEESLLGLIRNEYGDLDGDADGGTDGA